MKKLVELIWVVNVIGFGLFYAFDPPESVEAGLGLIVFVLCLFMVSSRIR